MTYALVTDSCCNLTEDMIESFGIHILPLTFLVDGTQYQSYLKGERTDLKQFFTMMREGKVITTSLPNPADTKALFEELLEAGQDILYIGFSSALSGTYEATELLARDLAPQFPERSIRCVETLAASGGQGLIIHKAARMREEGASLAELATWVEENRGNVAHWFTVDDLMFLFRGGRVSKTSAWAGTLLNIKPILHVDDEGRLVAMEKVRGRKKSISALLDHMKKTALEPACSHTVFITHGDCLEDAEALAQGIRDAFGNVEIVINYIDPVIGAHAGPGTLALFYMATER